MLDRFKVFLVGLIALTGLSITTQAADDSRKIDLYLFGKNVIEEYDGCHIAFWQANKNPKKDKFSYVFYAPFNDGQELPGWLKVDGKVLELDRRDKVRSQGRMIEPMRLYRSSKNTYSLFLEISKQHEEGDDIRVDEAKITLVRSKHDPFVITVKGELACPASAYEETDAGGGSAGYELYGDAISLGSPYDFDNLGTIPPVVLAAVKREAPNCEPENTPGFGSNYMVSESMVIWEVPCNVYASTGSSVFVSHLYADSGEYANVLGLPSLPGSGNNGFLYEMRLPRVSPKSATFVSEFYDGDGSCGSYEKYQLRAVEGEALEFFLLEYRNKPKCDGRQGEARSFPLVFQAGG